MTVKKRPRTARREAERSRVREAQRAARDRAALAALELGAAPERPLDVATPALVDLHAASLPCTACGGKLRVDEHAAVTLGAARLRVARCSCAACGARREVWFRVAPPLPN